MYSQWVTPVGCVAAEFVWALPRLELAVGNTVAVVAVVVAAVVGAIVYDVARPLEYAVAWRAAGEIGFETEWTAIRSKITVLNE